MRRKHNLLAALAITTGLVLTGCAGSNARNRSSDTGKQADHTGAMSGTGGTTGSGTMQGTTDLDPQNRTGSATGMSSGTTGGGTSLSGTARKNNPNRRDR